MQYEIKNNKGHYEVYVNGKFVCSADSEAEAESEICKYEEALSDKLEV